MEKRSLDVFEMEISRQASFAVLAFQDLGAALNLPDSTRIWYSVQAFLVAAANVSKLLWPKRKASANRGQELRAALDVSETSPLKSRAFRNLFEHYDEQLEDWMASSKRHNIVDSSVLPLGAIQGIDPGDYLRNIDPTDWTLTFRGSRLDLRVLFAALLDTRNRAAALVSQRNMSG